MFSVPTKYQSFKILYLVFLILVIYASTQPFLLEMLNSGKGEVRSFYNNYLIFKHSFFHLLENRNLYIHYPQEHNDLFKYSPTFSLVFGTFAVMPDWAGLFCWNLLNGTVLLLAIRSLPFSQNVRLSIACFVALEMTGSMHTEQSNALMAGLMIASFGLLERKRVFFTAFCIVAATYIKLFGIAACCLLLFYPDKWKSVLYMSFWMVLFWLIPLVVLDFGQLVDQYGNWLELLKSDFEAPYNYSLKYGLGVWFGLELDKSLVLVLGLIILLIQVVAVNFSKNVSGYRSLILASILIWVIIFNHKAESPTFVISVSGMAIWYFIQERNTFNLSLLIIGFILTCLTPTDIFPRFIRDEWFRPYIVKTIPSVLIWFKIGYDVMTGRIKFKSLSNEADQITEMSI